MIPLCVILVLVGGCMKNGKDVVTTDALKEDAGMASTAPTGAIDIPLLTTWPGDFPMARLALLPEGQRDSSVGYFGDEASFASAWSAFKPDEALPSVDFEESIVVFLRNTQFYNRIMMGKGILKDGVLEMIAAETMSARPIEDKAAMSMAVVPRAGVKSIQNGPQSIAVAPR
jgi:hypothetical protein